MNLPTSFVGISSHVERVETLLCLDSPKFRIVGLWGMGGIGKTTIAEAVFNRIYSRFDGFHFVENVSKEFKSRSVNGLREEIVLKLFEEERLKMGNRTLRPDFITKQFQRKKVLLVLDDLDDVLLAKKLLDDHLFCGGSRVLVTSRDKQVLNNIVGDQNQIYEVKGLSEECGLQLFSLHAFKLNHPTSNRLKLSKRVLSYARGNPLALVVLGCALFDKSKEEWVSALDGLGDEPFPDIQKVLRISYDALSEEEKTIFVDISAFLVGKKLDFVVAYYERSVKRIKFKISNLVDKSLLTISKNKKLMMHDLLKEMGRSFESAKRLEERTRIWDLKDVSKEMKESSMIEAISVNLSQVERISEFARLDRLKFLELYRRVQKVSLEEYRERFISRRVTEVSKVRSGWERFISRCVTEVSKVWSGWERFRSFPEELRYLRWDAYPHESLPSNFCVENLVELHMPDSAIRKLWTGKQNIVNLKVINLGGANKLVEFPDVSEGRNIERINLHGCTSLVKLPPSIQHLSKLEYLDLMYCPSVERAPSYFDSKVIKVIDLSSCGGVKMFPQAASQGNIIRELKLYDTDLREVPSSVELLKGLEKLSMVRCEKLSIISTNICKLKSLLTLDLHGCTNLESFPEIMEPMESLTSLDLNGCTRLKRLPSDHSFHNLKSLEKLYLGDTAITELPPSIQHLICLQELHISGCQNLTSLPSFIHNQRMRELYLEGCLNLCSLPELHSSLETLKANGCVSLKTISSACFGSESKTKFVKFVNCFKWDEEERRRVLDIAFSNLQDHADRREILDKRRTSLDIICNPYVSRFEMMLPWSEIPQWFGSQSVGSSLTLKLPMDDRCYRFAFCVVIKPNYANSINVEGDSESLLPIFRNYLECCVDGLKVTHCSLHDLQIDSEHVLLWWDPGYDKLREHLGREVSLQFRHKKEEVEVTRCGVVIF